MHLFDGFKIPVPHGVFQENVPAVLPVHRQMDRHALPFRDRAVDLVFKKQRRVAGKDLVAVYRGLDAS